VRTVASYLLAAQHRRYRGGELSSPRVAMYAGNTLALPLSTGEKVHVLAHRPRIERDVNKTAAAARERLSHLRNRVVHESIN